MADETIELVVRHRSYLDVTFRTKKTALLNSFLIDVWCKRYNLDASTVLFKAGQRYVAAGDTWETMRIALALNNDTIDVIIER